MKKIDRILYVPEIIVRKIVKLCLKNRIKPQELQSYLASIYIPSDSIRASYLALLGQHHPEITLIHAKQLISLTTIRQHTADRYRWRNVRIRSSTMAELIRLRSLTITAVTLARLANLVIPTQEDAARLRAVNTICNTII